MNGNDRQLPLLGDLVPEEAASPVPIQLGSGNVRIGTCGYSYKEWVGPFYSRGTASGAMLRAYARHFPAVELDTTYYGIPAKETFEGMDARTPAGFRFTAKLPGSLTHAPAAMPEPPLDEALMLRENMQPLAAAGKLGALLAQFPNGFRPGGDAERRLAILRDLFPDVPLAAEFRHRDWQTARTLDLLRDLGIAWVNVDEPHFETLLRPSSDVVTDLAYVRFHGRNAQTWWKGNSAERYSYDYSAAELEPWASRVSEMAEAARETYVMFNNHRFGAAPRDAKLFASILAG